MANPTFLSYLYATLTQGGADAFVQATIATPFTGFDAGVGARVKEILIEYGTSTQGTVAISATSRQEVAITRKSLSAIPDISAPSLVLKQAKATNLSTNGGGVDVEMVRQVLYTDENAPLMVEANWYAQLDSNNTAVVNVARIRIGYEVVKVPEVQRLAIIAASLQ